jgi:hypothetical protein
VTFQLTAAFVRFDAAGSDAETLFLLALLHNGKLHLVTDR